MRGYLLVDSFALSFGLAFLACGGSSKTPPSDEAICTPGERVCEGLNVKQCNEAGTAQSIEETCKPDESCSDGVCGGTSCVPNTKLCKGGQIYKCDSRGSGSALVETCSSSEFCLEQDEDAECSATACKANEAMCDGSIATVCKADGSGPEPGGSDCSDSGQVCYQGSCRAQACKSGEKVCQHNDVYLCASGGSELVLLADCGEAEVCDGTMGTCRPKLCEPGKLSCDETRPVTCNEYGSGWQQSGTDCRTSDEICVAGDCRKQACAASSTFCKNGSVHQCDAAGVSSTLYSTCDPDYSHCEAVSASYAYCDSNECTPGQLVCHDNYVKTCTATGSYPSEGSYCGDNKFCMDGACQDRGCEANTYLCKSGDVYYCEYFTGPSLSQNCPADATCRDADGSATCVPLPCSPDEPACLANKVGTCGDDGNSLSSVDTDCAAADQVCDATGACVASTIDTLGIAETAETLSAGFVLGDVIEVHSARKLTELEANLVLASPRELRWVIYEQTGGNFVARLDKLTSNQSGAGFFSSGPLDYTLKAGKRYLLALTAAGGNVVAYYDSAPWSRGVSFGTLQGRISGYYSATLSANYYYQEHLSQMRVTTALP